MVTKSKSDFIRSKKIIYLILLLIILLILIFLISYTRYMPGYRVYGDSVNGNVIINIKSTGNNLFVGFVSRIFMSDEEQKIVIDKNNLPNSEIDLSQVDLS